MVRTLIGFVLFGLCASGLYILNDLLDLHSDPRTPLEKRASHRRRRNFNSRGAVSLADSALFGAHPRLLLEVEFGPRATRVCHAHHAVFALFQEDRFVGCLHSFEFLQLSYSRRGLDLFHSTLAVVSGVFDVFFLSLAMAKRYSELLHASDLIHTGNSGRGYRTGDRDLLLSLGVGSSFSAVVIFSLYVHNPDVSLLYSSPEFLFLLCPIVLYWLSRTWLQAHRGELKEDPVTLAIRDPVSYAVAVAAAIVIAASMIHVNW